MELSHKDDCQQAEARIEAWWHGEIIDRAVIQVTAPREGTDKQSLERLAPPANAARDETVKWFTDVDLVVSRLEAGVEATYWGGEAFPVVYPVSTRMVAILAAYLGCPYKLVAGSNTGWADPIIDDWAERPRFTFNPDNEWWLLSKKLLDEAAQRAPGRYYVGLPDLNGPSQILALLRGTEQLAIDLMDQDWQVIREALDELNVAWLRYWQACVGVIHQWIGGYFYWMNIWSDRPSIDLQNDFSCLISPRMFKEVFLPSLEQQTRWVERTIYHLDGPNAIRHLDLLLSLPELDGIQWVPGAGAPPMSKWIPLLRRIQAKGKLLVLHCERWEVKILLSELEPEGMLLSTTCETEQDARDLLKQVSGWTVRRQWLVP